MQDSSGHFQMVGGATCKFNKNAKALKKKKSLTIFPNKNIQEMQDRVT